MGVTKHGSDVQDQRWHVVAAGSVPQVVERCNDMTLHQPLAPDYDAVSHQLVKTPIVFTVLLYLDRSSLFFFN
jgi:hypothetical protein